MKVLLDIQDDKATQLLEALEGLPYVEAQQITGEKALLIEELKESVEEMKLVLEGRKPSRKAEDFLNEI